MTDRPMPRIPKGLDLTPEQIEAISGGECTVQGLLGVTSQLKQSYEDVIDFTSYVIERVAAVAK